MPRWLSWLVPIVLCSSCVACGTSIKSEVSHLALYHQKRVARLTVSSLSLLNDYCVLYILLASVFRCHRPKHCGGPGRESQD
jgi:hypothetical protein